MSAEKAVWTLCGRAGVESVQLHVVRNLQVDGPLSSMSMSLVQRGEEGIPMTDLTRMREKPFRKSIVEEVLVTANILVFKSPGWHSETAYVKARVENTYESPIIAMMRLSSRT